MVSCMMKLCIAWKLQPIPLVVVSETFNIGAGQLLISEAILLELLLVNKQL